MMALVIGFGLFSSCKPDDNPEPSIEEANLNLLVDEWTLDVNAPSPAFGAKLGTTDKDSEYPNFNLKIEGTFSAGSPAGPYTYTVTSMAGTDYPTSSPWPTDKNGTWIFDDSAPETTIIRDDGTAQEIIMSYTVTENSLQLIFEYTRDGSNGRASSVAGTWVMNFIPKP